MIDPDYRDLRTRKFINDPIAFKDYFSQFRIVKFRNNSTHVRRRFYKAGFAKDLLSNQFGKVWRVFADVVEYIS
ncbi:MAG: hypothetical protein K0S09_3107 [Sphingobacteriaceae bacterium]|nr:hypothetical protein [Sphingobacteriaceae bacterium]